MRMPAIGFSGRYKLTVFYGDSDIITQELPWFDNLITDRGLDLLGYGYNAYCYVGSNLTSLDPSICAITGVLGGSSSVISEGIGVQVATLPYYAYDSYTYDFAVGSVVGTIKELGIGNSATDLFSRAYLLNSQGQQTTLTLGAYDRLQLTYELRVYPPTDQFNFSFDVDGTTYSGTGNAAWVANIDAFNSWGWALSPGRAIGGTEYGGATPLFRYSEYLISDSTALGAVTGSPNGTIHIDPGAMLIDDYVQGSYKRTVHVTWPIGSTYTNITAILSGIFTRNPFTNQKRNSTGMWQLLFSPGITKMYYQHLTLSWEIEWTRYTP